MVARQFVSRSLAVLLGGVALFGAPASAGDSETKLRHYELRCSASSSDDDYAYLFEPSIFQWKNDEGKKKDAKPDGTYAILCDPRNQTVRGLVRVPKSADGASGQELTFNVYRYKKADISRSSDVPKELKKRDIWVWSIRTAEYDKDGEQTNTVRAPALD